MGGKEAASARYIFTSLSQLTRVIINEQDDQLLSYIEEEGLSIEPQYYAPTIPMVLVNGAEGIGTGWSTFNPQYNPADVIKNIEAKLRDPEYQFQRMLPWYKNFKGKIEPSDNGGYTVTGVWRKIDRYQI
mgnify:CR=1 FL=1